MSGNNVPDKLDRTLSAIEQIYLGALDKDVIADDIAATTAVVEMKRLFATQLKNFEQSTMSALKSAVTRATKKPSTILSKGEFAARLNILKRIIASRRDLSPRLSSVFGSGREPSEVELSELTEELVRLGILNTSKDDE